MLLKINLSFHIFGEFNNTDVSGKLILDNAHTSDTKVMLLLNTLANDDEVKWLADNHFQQA
uniref:Uncharacterized protein n=1 Tax=Solanum lycopersicum TaxID=4081 RepID=A0A3Q7IN33_SOLLC